MGQSVTVESIGPAKLLAGFALHVTSAVIVVNHELSADKENAQARIRRRSAAQGIWSPVRAIGFPPFAKVIIDTYYP